MQDDELIACIRALTSPLAPEPTGLPPCIERLDGVRAVLFDVYGTLVISGCGDIGLTAVRTERAHAHRDPFRQALASIGIDPGSLPAGWDGAAALTAGIGDSHRRSRSRGVEHPEVDLLAIWDELLIGLGIAADRSDLRRLAVEYECRVNPVWPMPALLEVIETLAARRLVLGIVSNAQFYTPLMLTAFLGRDLDAAGFDPRCCAWSYRHLVAKPSTQVYEPALAALRRHHAIAPAQTLYIGNDVRNDIRPASRLGCRTALFAGDARSLRLRQDDTGLRGVVPDRVLTALPQIITDLLPE